MSAERTHCQSRTDDLAWRHATVTILEDEGTAMIDYTRKYCSVYIAVTSSHRACYHPAREPHEGYGGSHKALHINKRDPSRTGVQCNSNQEGCPQNVASGVFFHAMQAHLHWVSVFIFRSPPSPGGTQC
jgi:hypothetical protein